MPKRAPYFHVYMGLMVVFASYAMGATMRVRDARLAAAKRRQMIVVSKDQPVLTRKQAKAAESVCMLVVSYAFFDEANRPLRYLSPELNGASRLSAVGTLNVGFDGTGEIFLEEAVRTGLYLGDGRILADGPVAHPLTRDPGNGIRRLHNVTAYFPKYRSPFPLRLEACSKLDEVACFKILADSPPLPVPKFAKVETVVTHLFDEQSGEIQSVMPVMAVGYRSGNDGVLVPLVEGPLKQEVNWRSRFSEKAAILAANDVIVPEVTKMQVMVSGGRGRIDNYSVPNCPIFNQKGEVIGIPVSNFERQIPTDIPSHVIPIPLALKRLEIDRNR